MIKNIYFFTFLLLTQLLSATTYYVSPSGSNSNDGLSSSAPFQTIQYAIETVASVGDPATDKVILLDGNWPSSTTIASVTACTQWTTNLLIEGENSNVLLKQLNIYCQHLTFRGFKITGVSHEWGGDNVTLEDIIGAGKTYWKILASNIIWRGCQATDNFTEPGDVVRLAASGNLPERVPTNILFEDCCFRGSSTTEGNHIDVIQSIGSVNFTMRNCKIYHVPTGLFMPTKVGSVPLDGFLFENCYFGDGRLYTGHNNDNFVVKNCVIEATIDYTQTATYKPYHEWRGNKIRSWGAAVDEMPTVFEDNIVQTTTWTLPPSNIIDPNLVLTEPDCPSRAVPDGISVTPTTMEMAVNESAGLMATVTPSNASQTALWTSSDNDIATVDQNGVVTALQVGTVDIKVETTHSDLIGNQFEAICTVNIITDNNPPTVPGNVTVTGTTHSSITINYSASTDDRVVAGYNIYVDGTIYTNVTTTNPTITGLNSETSYTISVSAVDGAGNESGQTPSVQAETDPLPDVISNTNWQTFSETTQTGAFTATFTAIPNAAGSDAITGILNGTADEYGDLACIIRFNPTGTIDARNGGSYTSTNTVSYTPGVAYLFEVDIDIPSHTYSVYVTPEGDSRQTVAANFAFRSEQAAVTQLNAWTVYATLGSHSVDGMTFGEPLPPDTEAPSVPDGLAAGATTSSSVALSWNASTDNIGVAGYKVYTDGANPVTVPGTSTTISGLSASTTYSFTVSAIDATGNKSAQSSSVSATTDDVIITGGYYCDPVNGSMSNDGSQSSPWSSLEDVFNAGKTFVAGDVIYLMTGEHGAVTITGTNSGNVTITAADGATPEVDYIKFVNASKWIVSKIEFSPAFNPGAGSDYFVSMDINSTYNTIDSCSMFSVLNRSSASDWNTKAWSGFDIDGSYNTIKNNHLQNIRWGFRVDHTADYTIGEYNLIEHISYDGIQSLGSYCIYQYNTIKNVYEIDDNHDDFFQCYSYDGSSVGTTTVYGCVLRGNTFISYTDPNQFDKSDCQGIGNFDGFYEDWVVENNVIMVDHYHGITFLGARNCTIVNNTVVKCPVNAFGMTPWIMVKHHKDQTPSDGMIVTNNISPDYDLDYIGTNAVISNNITTSDYTSHFVDYAAGDLHLKAGSSAIDSGDATYAPSIDFDGIARPQGDGIDVGAYEFEGTPGPVPVNVALNKPVTVESEYNTTYVAANAVDGNYSDDASRWISADVPDWIEIDLQGNYDVTAINFWTGYGGYNKPIYDYQLQYWDGSSWTDIVNVTGNSASIVTHNFSAVTTNKIKLNATSSADNLVRLYEIQVMGLTATNPITDLIVTPETLDVFVDETAALTVTVVPANADDPSYIWNTSNETVATIDAYGIVTAISPGTAVITATSIAYGTISDDCVVTVSEVLPTSITLAPASVTIYADETQDLTETVLPANAADKSVSWMSTDENVAIVDNNGLITAVNPGTCTISATANADTNVFAECPVTILEILPTSIIISPASVEIFENEEQQLTATVLPANTTNNTVSWISNDENVATVDATGLVTAVAPGNCVIFGISNADGNISADCPVTINQVIANPTNVALGKPVVVDSEYNSSYIGSNAVDGDNSDRYSRWVSADSSYPHWIEIDLQGTYNISEVNFWTGYLGYNKPIYDYQLQYINNGQWEDALVVQGNTDAIVNHTFSSVSTDKFRLYVTDGEDDIVRLYEIEVMGTSGAPVSIPVENVEVLPTSLSIEAGQTATLTATVLPENVTDPSVTWTSNDESVATIDNGVVTAVDGGSCIITVASVDNPSATATCNVTVTVPVSSISISPTSLTLDEGNTGNLVATVLPANATNQNVVWSSSDDLIATVNNGTVTAISEGECNITATSVSNPAVSANCLVTVNGTTIIEYAVTINGSNADRQIQSNLGLGSTLNELHRVGGSTGTLDGCAVHPFQLPALGEGEFVVTASFSVGLSNIANNPTGNVDLYGIPYRSSEDVLGTDYYQGVFNGDAGSTGLQDDFATTATPEPSVVSTSTAAETALADYINAQYVAGANAGDYIFLRINPNADDVQSYYYWNFYSAEASSPDDRPVLILNISNDPSLKSKGSNQKIENKLNAESFIKVYPNPCGISKFTIELQERDSNSQVELKLFDISGKLIVNKLMNSNKLTINTEGLGKGIYFVTIQNGDKQYQEKVIMR